jgi:hypothetical protein
LYLGVPAPWSSWWFTGKSSALQLGVSGDDGFVRRTWRSLSFMEKFLSRDDIEVIGNLT